MKNAKILFLMFSLCYASISAATVAIQVETHFNTPCFALRGYWIPESRLNIRFTENHAANTLIIPSTQTVNHKDILYFCENNQIDKLISAYQQLQSDSNAVDLLKVIMFPDSILDVTPYASCVEENNATKLAILLSAVSGNIEGRALASELLSSITSKPAAKERLVYHQKTLQKSLKTIVYKFIKIETD